MLVVISYHTQLILFYLCFNFNVCELRPDGTVRVTDTSEPSLLAYEILQSGSIIAFNKPRDLARSCSLRDSDESACMCRF